MSLLNINDIINNKKIEIRGFIKDNYTINGTYTIKNGVFNGSKIVIVDVDGDMYVKNGDIKSLTNGLFRWGIIKGYFDCGSCNSLESLEGAPKECEDFYCNFCNNLKSLKGAPEKCKIFDCSGCDKLKSLIGTPKECRAVYCMYDISIKSIEGIPTKCTHLYRNGCIGLPDKKEILKLFPNIKHIG